MNDCNWAEITDPLDTEFLGSFVTIFDISDPAQPTHFGELIQGI